MPMRALCFETFGGPLTVRDLPAPHPAADGVVVEVAASGICRSDWHGWQGHDPDVVLPHVPGHELAGTVGAVGPGVRRWRGGDRGAARGGGGGAAGPPRPPAAGGAGGGGGAGGPPTPPAPPPQAAPRLHALGA